MCPQVSQIDTNATTMPTNQEESRSERVTISVTPSEKRAIKGLAAILDSDESNLCRTTPIDEIVTRFEKIRDAAA